MFAVKRLEVAGGGQNWVGTGYHYSVYLDPSDTSSLYPVVVTNKHVVENAEKIDILFHVAANHKLSGEITYLGITKDNGGALLHPSADLALITVGNAISDWNATHKEKTLFWMGITDSNLVLDKELSKLDACEAITMVGCPSGLWDETNGFPLFRRGITSTHPGIDFRGHPEFVVDIGVYSGSSGSPVFLMDQGLLRPDKSANSFAPMTRFGLLGTLWGGPRITEQGELVVEPAPTDARVGIQTSVRMHLGYVIKARELKFLIDKFKDSVAAENGGN